MRIALYSIPMFLLLAAGTAQAQANRIPADRTPTSGVTETPTLPPRISTSPATDSVMAGGDAVPLPGGQWNMGGTPNPGNQPPPPAVSFDPSGYAASDAVNGAGDVASAGLEIYVLGNGACMVRVAGTVNAGDHACGSFIPASANLSDYQVRIVPSGMTAYVGCAASAGSAGYTPSADTGWLSFPAGGGVLVSISASAGQAMGMSCPGSSATYGAYAFQVRRVGDSGFTTSTVQVSANADNAY